MKSMLRQTTLSLALVASFAGAFTWSTDSHACNADSPYIGSVCYTAGNFCPNNYLAADGTPVAINQYQALYAVISTTYGGNGGTNFNLPDLRGRAVIGWGNATAQTSTVAFGAKRGTETVTLAANQVPLPQHTHPAVFTPVTGQQAVTLPAQPGSGAITATAATDVVPGNVGVDPGPSVPNYYLTGVSSSAAGPVTTTVPGTNKSTLIGTQVTVNTSTYKPAIAQQTVNITAVTGGAVAIGAAGAPAAAPVSLVSPQQALTACIAVNGIYPTRP